MPAYVALLRAVNVGGTGKLPMSELKAMCEAQGFEAVKTHIANGNVVFRSTKSEAVVGAELSGHSDLRRGRSGSIGADLQRHQES